MRGYLIVPRNERKADLRYGVLTYSTRGTAPIACEICPIFLEGSAGAFHTLAWKPPAVFSIAFSRSEFNRGPEFATPMPHSPQRTLSKPDTPVKPAAGLRQTRPKERGRGTQGPGTRILVTGTTA